MTQHLRAHPLPHGQALRERIVALPVLERDAWVDTLLNIGPLPDDAPDLPPSAVPYLPCPVDDVLALVQDAPVGPNDEVVDLGSGLGRVAILVHLLTGARTGGIEIQAHLVQRARALCRGLGLADTITFTHGDAAQMDLDGSIFFLYAPFNGPMLKAVLQRLEAVAQRRRIVVCAVAMDLRGVGWLRPRPFTHATVSLYDS